MRNFCNLLPEDRKLCGPDNDLENIVHGDSRKRTYTVATTGAKLTYRHAVDVLSRFASSLVREDAWKYWVLPMANNQPTIAI